MPETLDSISPKQHVPLHVHTEYSLLDGASRIPDICRKAKEEGMPALAITDHGTMYGCYTFYHEAKQQGIKPILGCEVYLINGDHSLKGKENRLKLYHLVLLAKNDRGYKNLIKIVSEACVNGFYYKPRISKEYLKEYSEDLIALSACLGGEVNNLLLNNKDEEAKQAALEYQEIFGEDFYLEIMDHYYPEDRHVNPKVVALAKELGIKVVATNDSHYTNQEDASAHDALLCLQTQEAVANFPRMHFSAHEFLKTEEEMYSLFRDHLSEEDIYDAVKAVPNEIAGKIEDYQSFAEPGMHMPDPKVPEGFSFETYLKEISYQGAEWRFGKLDTLDAQYKQDIVDRLEKELEIMNGSGFASYFIVVWDFIKWAREHDIPVGPGRGSAAGSLVAYCLGITNIDPLKYDLLFERFLNPERKSMPDIDTDFCIERREEVIDYVREKYGEENVCQIITFNRLTSRSVIKDMARVLEYPYSQAEQLAKMIPVVRGKPRSIAWMIENHDEFKKKYHSDPEAKQVVDLAMKNEGLNKTFGVHAAGVIIADQPVSNIIPISKNNDGSVITQFAMEEAANMGLLKMDFLGLRNLTMINKALDIIQENQSATKIVQRQSEKLEEGETNFSTFVDEHGRIDIDAVPMDDVKTYDTLCSGNLSGIFQLETSAGMRQVARDLAPRNLEDISALIALYRPGPLDTGMIDDFINRKSGKEKITYDHPLLESILKNTYGTIVYQEQIMQIAQVLAGFSLGEADLLRRAMGKKKPEVLLPFQDKFLEGCQKNTEHDPIPLKVGEKLFEQMLAFAEYCFNKSHSTAYGFVTYQTAFLKTHFPVEYLTSLFMSCNGDTDKIKGYIIEAERLGIEVAAPNINLSGADFTAQVADNTIVFGLTAIKGVGAGPVASILEERSVNGPFTDFFDFCRRVDHKLVNKKTIEGLIKCGAMDDFSLGHAEGAVTENAGRKAMLENLESFVGSSKRKQQEAAKGQASLFDMMAVTDDSVVNYAKPSYINGVDDEYPERELQTMEYQLLGLFVNNHPMQAMQRVSKAVAAYTLPKLESAADNSKVSVTALITSFERKITKSKKMLAVLQIEDMEARCEAVVFSKKLEALEPFIEKGKRVLLSGTLSKHSEGSHSILVDNMQDLDEMQLLEFDFDVSEYEDVFRLFHAIKSFSAKPENSGESIIVLNMFDSSEHEQEGISLSLGAHAKIANTEFARKGIEAIFKKFRLKPEQAIAA